MSSSWESPLDAAYEAGRAAAGGAVTQVYPALAAVSPDVFDVACHRLSGETLAQGSGASFILMSVAKAFTLALAVDMAGEDRVLALTGMEATGLAFNDPAAITRTSHGRTNPMVNPGALTVASLVGDEAAIRDGLSRFAGRDLAADPVMVEAIRSSNQRNRLLAELVAERGLLATDVETALHLYTYQSCLEVDAGTLARMGAVLASEGRDPVSGSRVVTEAAARVALEAMSLAGLYEASGAWRTAGGPPAKSGIAGGLVMVLPGRGGFAAYSPPLEESGNPLRALAAARAFAGAVA